jgi:3-oxoacyl-[acyl-carrier protein] reductase
MVLSVNDLRQNDVSRELQGKVAVVTGSSRGIGAAIATLLASKGAHVAVHGRDAGALESVRARIAGSGGEVLAVLASLSDLQEIELMREQVESRLGTVDILVANAGGSPVRPGPVEDISEADWHRSVDANLTATFLTIKSFLPGMKQRGNGSIITMSSAAARRPTAGSPVAYAAAKAGIELLTREVALQAGPHGVRANCIAPETILTERNLQQIPDGVQQDLIGSHPVRRLGTPEDVARAVLFLASESASWVSGVVLDVAGGSVLA